MFELAMRVVFAQDPPNLGIIDAAIVRLPLRVGRLISMMTGLSSVVQSPCVGGTSGAMLANAVSVVNLIALRLTHTFGAERHQRPNDLIFKLYNVEGLPLVCSFLRMKSSPLNN
jgi:hypothetical protein